MYFHVRPSDTKYSPNEAHKVPVNSSFDAVTLDLHNIRGLEFFETSDQLVNDQITLSGSAYKTAPYYWTLNSWSISAPEYEQQLIPIPGGTPLDVSGALSPNGEPTYKQRTFKARLECSEGTWEDRELLIADMINRLNGRRLWIGTPGNLDYYLIGRVSVQQEYNDVNHCAVYISALCDPWRYANTLSQTHWTLTAERKHCSPFHSRKPVCPEIYVDGTAHIEYEYRGKNVVRDLTTGKYQFFDLWFGTGGREFGMPTIYFSGTGTLNLTCREAVL